MFDKRVLWTLMYVASGLAAPATVFGQSAVPIPPGYDFPADEETLLQMRDTDDVSGMRRHGWMVFAGMTQPAPDGEAIWETWYRSGETFDTGPAPAGPRRIERRFAPPRQFLDPSVPAPLAPGKSLLSFVLLNQEAHDWIRNNKFNSQAELDSINSGFPAGTPLPDRKILDAPREAMTLKTVWWRIQATGITPLPIWDFQPTQPDAMGNDFDTWRRVVGVDPTRESIPPGETANLVFPPGTAARTGRVVPLNRFYHFAVTPQNVGAFTGLPANERPVVGDHVALVALHYTTKEIPDWVWATFWWHDQPDHGPFAADRTAYVSGVWRNYLMDVAYSMDTPREFDGTPNSCYNPWLEARFQNGMQSNCMTCHQRAVWPPQSFLPITRGSLAPDDPFFKDVTKADFLWSIIFESQP